MPIGNKGSRFKNLDAKKLAEKWELDECVLKTYISKKRITINDVQYIIDNINYDSKGVSLFDKNNVPLEKRYCNNNIPLTKTDFKSKYGKDYKKIWDISIIYKPNDELLDDFFDIINENCSYY